MAKAHVQQGLRTKIVAWSFIPTAIILSAVAWFTFYSYQKVLVEQAVKQDRTVVVEKANEAIRAVADLLNPTVLPIFLEIDIHHEESLEVRAENILNKAKGL